MEEEESDVEEKAEEKEEEEGKEEEEEEEEEEGEGRGGGGGGGGGPCSIKIPFGARAHIAIAAAARRVRRRRSGRRRGAMPDVDGAWHGEEGADAADEEALASLVGAASSRGDGEEEDVAEGAHSGAEEEVRCSSCVPGCAGGGARGGVVEVPEPLQGKEWRGPPS